MDASHYRFIDTYAMEEYTQQKSNFHY